VAALGCTKAEAAEQTFGDWTAACTPDGYCVASTPGSGATGDGGGPLRIGRLAQGTYWEMSVALASPVAPAEVEAALDGWSVRFAYPAEFAPYGDAGDYFLLGRNAQALLDRLPHGQSLELNVSDPGQAGTPTRYSLAGLAQALIWIDGEQGRIGSERVTGPPPDGLFRADVPGAAWMAPALAAFFGR
jgi:hypothetical protein